jgi:hypothetical protein
VIELLVLLVLNCYSKWLLSNSFFKSHLNLKDTEEQSTENQSAPIASNAPAAASGGKNSKKPKKKERTGMSILK